MAVFKLRKPKARWADPNVPEFSEHYYLKLTFRGKQILRSTGEPTKAAAERIEARLRRELNSERWAEVLGSLEDSKLRKTGPTLGQVIAAYIDPEIQLLKDPKQVRRNVNDLRLVVAWARDLWTTHTGGIKGVKIGAQIADVARIDALQVSTLDHALVLAYYRARQGGESLNLNHALEENTSINSTLGHARDVFSEKARRVKYRALKLPDLSDFLREPLLPELPAEPQPIQETEFAAMLQAWRGLGRADDLWLVNLILRRTGLRSGSVEHLQGHWLQRMRDGWWLHVRVRKGRTAEYSLPIDDELAGFIRERGDGYTISPGATPAARADLVHRQHNDWLKRIIGGSGELVQGNHRLRDTVGSILKSWLGTAVASRALGHADERTTTKHYARLQLDVSDEMRAELAAFTRLAVGSAGSSIRHQETGTPGS